MHAKRLVCVCTHTLRRKIFLKYIYFLVGELVKVKDMFGMRIFVLVFKTI